MERKNEIGELFTTKEAAARMRISTDTLTVMALRGDIPSIKLGTRRGQRGGRRLFPVAEVEAWLQRNLKAA